MKKAISGLLMLLGPVSSWAGGLDLSLSNDTANLSIMLNPAGESYGGGGGELAIGVFVNEVGDNLLHATLMAHGMRQSDLAQYRLGAGVKLIGGDLDIDETVGALALGFQATLLLSSSPVNPVDLTVEGFFAPKISSFTDAEEYSELGAKLQIEVIPQARAYIGYRRMVFDTNDFPNLTIDRNVHVGLSLRF